MKTALKHKVQKLRKGGLTYSEIAKKVKGKISKSTISFWCRDIKTPHFYAEKLAHIAKLSQARGRRILDKRAIETRREFMKNVKFSNGQLLRLIKYNKNAKKIALTMLYLGEGAKWSGHRGLMLGSSEPLIVFLYIELLRSVYSIQRNDLRARISYRADQNLKNLQNFWSKKTGIPLKHFYKSKPDRRTIGKITKNKNYKGVCVITCAGTEKQLELEALAKMIGKIFGPIA